MLLTRHLHVPKLLAMASLLAGLGSTPVHATLITFDDLPSPGPEFGDTSVTNEYESLGLVVNSGLLVGVGPPGTNRSLLGSPDIYLSFVGALLPTYVSFYVNTPIETQSFSNASGPGGWTASFVTDGFGPPGTETPYRPNQYVSFHSEGGISHLDISAYFNLRAGPQIDNLYFGRVPPVPEPGSLALLGIGALVLAAVRRKKRRM